MPEKRATEWWDSLSTYKKGSAIAIAVCFLMLGIFFIISHWKSILGIVVAIVIVLGAITSLVQMVKNSASGSKETRTKARRGLIFCAVLCVVFGAMIFSALRDHDPYFFQPGSSVHNSYLTQINAHETIGKVFCDYFEGGKWSTYKENGYSYAAFSATGRFWGERADVQIAFRVKEDEFFLDHMDVNGHEQDELTTLLLSEIYGEALI